MRRDLAAQYPAAGSYSMSKEGAGCMLYVLQSEVEGLEGLWHITCYGSSVPIPLSAFCHVLSIFYLNFFSILQELSPWMTMDMI